MPTNYTRVVSDVLNISANISGNYYSPYWHDIFLSFLLGIITTILIQALYDMLLKNCLSNLSKSKKTLFSITIVILLFLLIVYLSNLSYRQF